MTQSIIERNKPLPPAPAEQPANILSVIQHAMSNNISGENLSKLLAVQEQYEAKVARSAFHRAMAAFSAQCPPIKRSGVNGQYKKVNKQGVPVPYTFASLEDIGRDTRAALAANGLSYRWGSIELEGDMLTVRCIVSHADGHSEESSASLPWPSKAGASEQQKVSAANTYAQRLSLIAALGLTSTDDDTDAEDARPSEPCITANQVSEIQDWIEHSGRTVAAFLQWQRVQSIADIPASRYNECKTMLLKAIKDREDKAKP